MRKKFFIGIALAIVAFITIGFLLPWLMSAKSWLAVMIASTIIVGAIVAIMYVILFKILLIDKMKGNNK